MKVIDYIRTYKQFSSSHHFYEGIRMTLGVMVPAILFSSYGFLQMGVTVALGSICVGITDNAGPIHHRRNGMLITMLLLFGTIVAIGLSVGNYWLTMVVMLILAFFFSLVGVYGNRAASAGLACMLIMVLNIDKPLSSQEVFRNALLTVTGGAWYFLLSMGLHRLRPYKLVQQVLGDCMQETAKYLRLKAVFYNSEVDYDKSYQDLADAQVKVHQKQEATRELLFKTRSIVKEATPTGRILVMSFIDTVDLFERILTSQQDYRLMQQHFGDSLLFSSFRQTILHLADDLDNIGLAFQDGTTYQNLLTTDKEVADLEALFLKERADNLNEKNADAFISFRHIFFSVKDLQGRIKRLSSYSGYDLVVPKPVRSEKELKRFVTRSDYSPKILFDNLNPQANIFRHSLRVCLSLMIGYIMSGFLPIGHTYWILLTIIVILKPAYALTRERNMQRLGGTLVGATIAALILLTIRQDSVLLAILMICMVITFSLIRTKYFLSVIFMTIYIIIAFNFLKAGVVRMVVEDRVIDTALGSFISFALIFLVPPKWEQENILSLCVDAIKANRRYYEYIACSFTGSSLETQQYKLRRKDSFVALANLGDAFQRMINEPKSKQQRGEYLHQMITSNHVMVSHVASLSSYRQQYGVDYNLNKFKQIIDLTGTQLELATQYLEGQPVKEKNAEPDVDEMMELPFREAQMISDQTGLSGSVFKTISDQFELVFRVAIDIRKIAQRLSAS